MGAKLFDPDPETKSIQLFIRAISVNLLYIPEIVLGTEDTALHKTDTEPALREFTGWGNKRGHTYTNTCMLLYKFNENRLWARV